MFDPATWLENPATQLWAQQSSKMWEQGVAFWTSLATLNPMTPAAPETAAKDRRFADPDWASNPVFAMIRQTYGLLTEQMLATTRQFDGLDPAARAKMEFAAKAMADAMARPTSRSTNRKSQRAVETRGEIRSRLEAHADDLSRGQLSLSIQTHSRSGSISRRHPAR